MKKGICPVCGGTVFIATQTQLWNIRVEIDENGDPVYIENTERCDEFDPCEIEAPFICEQCGTEFPSAEDIPIARAEADDDGKAWYITEYNSMDNAVKILSGPWTSGSRGKALSDAAADILTDDFSYDEDEARSLIKTAMSDKGRMFGFDDGDANVTAHDDKVVISSPTGSLIIIQVCSP